MQRLGMEEGVPIESKMVTKAIQRAQKQVEAQNFGIRKHLLEYDDVMNKQRESVYALRLQLLQGRVRLEDGEVDSREYLLVLADEVLANMVDEYADGKNDPEQWDLGQLREEAIRVFDLDEAIVRELPLEEMTSEQIHTELWAEVEAQYVEKEAAVGRDLLQLPDEVIPQIAGPAFFEQIKAAEGDARLPVAGRSVLAPIERNLMMQVVDGQWKDHLYSLDHLKEGIGLRGYGQRDPLVEYKKESYALFAAMKQRVDEETVRYLWRLAADVRAIRAVARRPRGLRVRGRDASTRAVSGGVASCRPEGPGVPEIFSQPKQLQENRPAPPAPGTGGGIFGAPAATATAAQAGPRRWR